MGICRLILVVMIAVGPLSTIAQTCPGSAGCMDPTFAGGTLVRVANAGGMTARSLIRQSDGKVIAMAPGRTVSDGYHVTRLNANGSIDTSFAGDGTLTTHWTLLHRGTTHYGGARAIALQMVTGTERILVAGVIPMLSGNKVVTDRLRIDRYGLDGTPDTSWGVNGTVQLNLNGALSIAVQPLDQKIVIGTGPSNQLIRLNETGQLDPTFGTSGIAPSTNSMAISIDALGRILVAGVVTIGTRHQLQRTQAVSRYHVNGQRDNSFGSNGTAIVGFISDYIPSVSTDNFGNVIVSAPNKVDADNISDFAVERFTDAGVPDIDFSGDGIATVDFDGRRDIVMGSAAQSDGRIVLVGNTAVYGSASGSDMAMARLDYWGNLDSTFGRSGRIVFPHTAGGESLSLLLMFNDTACACEKFYAAGINSQSSQLAVARFLEY